MYNKLIIRKGGVKFGFKISAIEESPLINPAFVIKNWGNGSTYNLQLKIYDQINNDNIEYQKGIETNIDGSFMLVIWMNYSSETTVEIEINNNKNKP